MIIAILVGNFLLGFLASRMYLLDVREVPSNGPVGGAWVLFLLGIGGFATALFCSNHKAEGMFLNKIPVFKFIANKWREKDSTLTEKVFRVRVDSES